MKIALATLAAVTLTAFTVPAAAAARPDAQADTASATQAASDKDAPRKTCRRFDNSARRTQALKLCLTKDEWKKFEAEQD